MNVILSKKINSSTIFKYEKYAYMTMYVVRYVPIDRIILYEILDLALML